MKLNRAAVDAGGNEDRVPSDVRKSCFCQTGFSKFKTPTVFFFFFTSAVVIPEKV